jgi:tight adherence protein B
MIGSELGTWLPLLGMVCLLVGMALALGPLWGTPDHGLVRHYRCYTAQLDRRARLCFLASSGRRIALWQLGLITLCGAGALVAAWPYFCALAAAVAAAPLLHLERKRRLHVARLETQIDSLLTALANALKSIPSPSAALGSLATTLPAPMSLEIERVLGELRVGSTLAQALGSLSERVKSPDLDSALSALLIGLSVGGNLPLVLENTAATVREMHRLEGVVKSKTAESRAQLWVLSLFPLVVAFGFNAISPSYFEPLRSGALGTAIGLGALFFWASALLTARGILRVDI